MFCGSTHTAMPFCSKWQVLLCSGCFKRPSEPEGSQINLYDTRHSQEKIFLFSDFTSPSTHLFPWRHLHSFYLSRGMKFSWDVEVWLYIIPEVAWQGCRDKYNAQVGIHTWKTEDQSSHLWKCIRRWAIIFESWGKPLWKEWPISTKQNMTESPSAGLLSSA